jgi:uncharacterized protein (DUF1501 family)
MASPISHSHLPTTRREFLRLSGHGIGLLAFGRFAPAFLVNSALASAPPPESNRSVLVLVQLAGGNDGLNTLVPFEDADYYRLRPTLGIPADKVLRVSDTLGLHPACAGLQRLFHDGKLAVVEGVGYPNPNRSHFRSTEIWETASGSGDFLDTGWVGRFLDNACSGAPSEDRDPLAIHANTPNGEPPTLVGAHPHPTFGLAAYGGGRGGSEESRRMLETDLVANEPDDNVGFLRQTLMDTLVTEVRVQKILGGYRPEAVYPINPFAASLRSVAALVAGDLPTRVYFVTLSGFDTHVNQAATQARLLGVLSEGLAAFQEDLQAHHLDGQVVTMTFSEFGRRPLENESRGTDHGTAAPLFVLGSRVRGGLLGSAPRLDLPPNQDLSYSTDFRSVYSTILDRWLGCPSETVLGGRFPALPLV